MRCPGQIMRLGAGLLLAWAGAAWSADGAPAPGCRIAFDMGSSGIRAGSTASNAETRMDLDVLSAVSTSQGVATIVPHTAVALRVLRGQGHWTGCTAQVGMGFSAWRLALQQDPGALVAALRDIHRATGVAVLVAPPAREGLYGYAGAQRALGARLGDRRVLDIGGGSLQVTGPQTVFGAPLGQKAWHRLLCQALGQGEVLPCALQPMNADELAQARRLAAEQLKGLPEALPVPVDMAAITRPVTRGVAPAVHRLRDTADASTLPRAELSAAIEAWAAQPATALANAAGLPAEHAGFLMSDMLLVEGLMTVARSTTLLVAEAEASNVRGILADDRAYRWAHQHTCYLQRLRALGEAAYDTDPATCPESGLRSERTRQPATIRPASASANDSGSGTATTLACTVMPCSEKVASPRSVSSW